MISEILVYFFCSVLSILLVLGVTAWVTLYFCADTEHAGMTVMVLGAEDRGVQEALTAAIRSDRLLNRTHRLIVVDAGMDDAARRITEQLAAAGRLVLVSEEPESVAAAILAAGTSCAEGTNARILKS